jgi:hypothetical protein
VRRDKKILKSTREREAITRRRYRREIKFISIRVATKSYKKELRDVDRRFKEIHERTIY